MQSNTRPQARPEDAILRSLAAQVVSLRPIGKNGELHWRVVLTLSGSSRDSDPNPHSTWGTGLSL